jgi:hypothetical protein
VRIRPGEVCDRILSQVSSFAAGVVSDDRTLMVVRFRSAAAATSA